MHIYAGACGSRRKGVLMLWWSVHMCRPKWVYLSGPGIHSGGFSNPLVFKWSLIYQALLINRLSGGIQIGHNFDSISKKVSIMFIMIPLWLILSSGSGLIYIQGQHYTVESTEECYSFIKWKSEAKLGGLKLGNFASCTYSGNLIAG